MARHTPETWSYYENRIYEEWGTGRYIANTIEWERFPDEAEANARRIVACINFCEGLSTEWLVEHLDYFNTRNTSFTR